MKELSPYLPRESGPNGEPSELFRTPDNPEQECPYVRFPAGGEGRIITSREDVVKVLTDPRFSIREVPAEAAITGATLQQDGLPRQEKPEITHTKRALKPFISSEEAERHRAGVETVAKNNAQDLKNSLKKRPIFLNSNYTMSYISQASQEILGLNSAEFQKVLFFSSITIGEVGISLRDAETVCSNWQDTYAFYKELINQKRDQEDQKLFSRLVNHLESRGITGDKLTQVVASYANGFPTLPAIMDICTVELLRRPDIVQECRQDPKKWDGVVDELLRYKAHFTSVLPRRAKEDVKLPSGQLIKEGEVVVPSIEGALHDPGIKGKNVEKPYAFDPNQEAKRKLVFGKGAHVCPGEALSRLLLRTGLEALFKVNPRLAFNEEKLKWLPGNPPAPVDIEVYVPEQPKSIRALGAAVLRPARISFYQ